MLNKDNQKSANFIVSWKEERLSLGILFVWGQPFIYHIISHFIRDCMRTNIFSILSPYNLQLTFFGLTGILLFIYSDVLITKSVIYITMKNAIKKTFGTAILAMVFGIFSFGQDYLKMEGLKELQFQNETVSADVVIPVTEEYNYLRINVEGYIENGEFLCEIIDPKGEVKRNFSILYYNEDTAGNNTGIQGEVKGEMEKAFRNPDSGKWKVRITPKKAHGQVVVKHILIFNSRADMLELHQIEEESN